MVYENLNGFAKGGAQQAKLATTITRVTYTGMIYSDEAWLVKDYDVGHFSFANVNEHWFDFKITDRDFHTAGSGALSLHLAWILANAIADVSVLNAGTFILVGHSQNKAEANYRVQLRERHAGNTYAVYGLYNLVIGTMYYAKVTWSGTDLALDVYSTAVLRDIGGNGDKAHVTLVLHANHSFRYLYAFNTFNLPFDPEITGYNENYDIHEGPFAPTVTTQPASDIGSTTATANGNITDTGGENCDERGFEWGLDMGGPYPNSWTEVGNFGTGAFSHIFTDLPCETTIYYRSKTHNIQGWSYGSEQMFTTEICNPTNLQAICLNATTIRLTWIDNSSIESNCYVERDDGGWHVIATLPASSTSYIDTTIECDTFYLYRVRVGA